jgi:hypothetical protein
MSIPLRAGPSAKPEVYQNEIKSRQAKASVVARGRGKFMPPKPGGKCRAVRNFLHFRKSTPADCENLYKYKQMIGPASVG